MNIDPDWPQWIVRQGHAWVWVRAPSAAGAAEAPARRLGPMGGWKTGPDVDEEVFPAEAYHDHATPGDSTLGPSSSVRARTDRRVRAWILGKLGSGRIAYSRPSSVLGVVPGRLGSRR